MVKRRAKGEGSIWYDKTNSRWMAKITLPNGNRRTKSGKERQEVLDWLAEQRVSAARGTYTTGEDVTLGDFIDSYMRDVAIHNLRPRTFESHSGYVRNHIKPELGHIKLSKLRPDHVQAFYAKKLEEGLAKRTVEYMHAILHKILKQAVRWDLVARNVTDLVDPPRPKQTPPKVWTTEQVKTFLDAVKDHHYYLIYLIAIYTGMRQAEILGIHKQDIDLENGIINVKNQVQPIRGKGLVVTQVKTEKSKRPVTLPETVLTLLRTHLESVESGLIFTASKGNTASAIWPHNLYRHFKATIEKLELPDVTFHSLRHFHATLLLQAGTNPKIVQERLGHSSVMLTLDTYSHVMPSLQEEVALKVEEQLA